MGWVKLRYQLLKEAQEDEGIGDEVEEDDIKMTEEEKERYKLLEAKRRQFYDPEEKIFNYNKKRVNDLRDNARVTLRYFLHRP